MAVEGDDALQMDQLSILEHGGDRLGALHTPPSDTVAAESAGERRGAACQKCSRGPDLLCGKVWRCAPYLSSFSDPLPLMQLAMMMAEATPRDLFDRSSFSVGVVPFSSSIGSGWPSTLRAHGRSSVQRGLNTSGVCRAVTLRAGSVQIWGSGARERGHGAALESLAQRGDALGVVCATVGSA